jgi:hypothetical protein
MRHGFIALLLLAALIVGCGQKKVEEVKGTPLKSREADPGKIKGKMVFDELPSTPPPSK